jgi:hypothetical protein
VFFLIYSQESVLFNYPQPVSAAASLRKAAAASTAYSTID